MLAAATVSATARASAWSYTGTAAVSAAYDDNVLLLASAPLTDYIGRLDYTVNLARVANESRWLITPRFVAVRYDRNRIYDHTEQYLTISNVYAGERGLSNLSFNLIRDTTLTSELGLTGLTATNKRRQSNNLTWSPSLQATERWLYGAQFAATTVHYAEAAHTSLVDYRYGMAAFYSSYQISPLSKLTLQFSGGRLEVPDNSVFNNANYAATIAYARSLGERWQLNLSAGPSLIRGAGGRGGDRGTVYGFSLARQLEKSSVSVSLSRDVTPNGLGLLARHEQATLNLRRALSEHATVSLNGLLVQTRNVLATGDLQLSKIAYSDIDAAFNWSWSPTWRLSFDVGHGQQANDFGTAAARRWHAALGVNWSGLERVLH